jgi:hypothetical protein
VDYVEGSFGFFRKQTFVTFREWNFHSAIAQNQHKKYQNAAAQAGQRSQQREKGVFIERVYYCSHHNDHIDHKKKHSIT